MDVQLAFLQIEIIYINTVILKTANRRGKVNSNGVGYIRFTNAFFLIPWTIRFCVIISTMRNASQNKPAVKFRSDHNIIIIIIVVVVVVVILQGIGHSRPVLVQNFNF